jgi:DNA-binding Lrp family transcriptional regulator
VENVFEDLYPTISSEFSSEEKIPVHKRHAFVFITAEPDSSSIALEDLKRVEGVIEIYPSHGAYDIIAKVTGESLEHLREVVFKQIKNISSIQSTLTLMVV